MKEGYYQPGPARSDRVRTLFDRIARRYDLINDLQSFGLHRLWKRRLLQMARIRRGEKALDVCCGTGDLAERLAAVTAPVLGCDFSSAMLEVAKSRGGAIQYVRGDALALPFRDETFDLVTVGYGLRNLADLRRGVQELLRVAKPNGRVLVLDFGKPSNPFWRAIYFAYLRLVVPAFGRVFCGDAAAYGYILESLKNYPAQEGVAAVFKEHGCGVQIHNFLGGMMSIHLAEKAGSLGQGHDVPLEPGDLVRG